MMLNGVLERLDSALKQRSIWFHSFFIIIQVLVLFWLDYRTGAQYSFSLFYLIPIIYTVWYVGLRFSIFSVTLSGGAWITAELLSNTEYESIVLPLWNLMIRLAYFSIIARLIGSIKVKMEVEEALADTDLLTNLHNARYFYEQLSVETARSQRNGRPLTVMYIDLDNFKQINDTQGHVTGDKLLKKVGEVLYKNKRLGDVAVRLGGDEFILLFPETDSRAAQTITSHLKKVLDGTMRKNRWPVTFSIGVFTFNNIEFGSEEMVKRADELMYQVKKSGKNRISYSSN